MRRNDCWYKKVCLLPDDECNACARYNEMKFLMDSAEIPQAQQVLVSLYPSNEDREAFIKLKNIKDNIVNFTKEGNNIYICSQSTGTAKTTWAFKIMMKYFDCIWSGNGRNNRGLYIHVPTLLFKLKDFNNPLSEEYFDKIRNSDLVIWDDIATGNKISDYDYNNLLMYIDFRLLNKKSNIYTSNIISNQQLSKLLGNRLASRIYNTSEVIMFNGKDARGKEF